MNFAGVQADGCPQLTAGSFSCQPGTGTSLEQQPTDVSPELLSLASSCTSSKWPLAVTCRQQPCSQLGYIKLMCFWPCRNQPQHTAARPALL